MKFVISQLVPGECDFFVCDNTGILFNDGITWTPSEPASIAEMMQLAIPLLATYATGKGYTMTTSDFLFPEASNPHVFSNPTRSLNTVFQISASREALVSYTVDIAAALSLTGGATGTVTLQYADNSGFSTNVVTVQSSVNGNAGTLTIGLGLTQTGTASLNGVIPAGKYVKLITANTVGAPTFTMRAAQEVLI